MCYSSKHSGLNSHFLGRPSSEITMDASNAIQTKELTGFSFVNVSCFDFTTCELDDYAIFVDFYSQFNSVIGST